MWLLRIFYFARLAPMTCLRPCHPKTVVSPLGVFSRAFFFLCPFCFFCFSRVRSFPSRCRFGSVSWLLFVVVAFVVSFVLWLGGVVRFCLAFSRCCLCVGCLVVGRFRGVCASWLVFGFWFCLVCLCACCALSRSSLGVRPPFFCAIAIYS